MNYNLDFPNNILINRHFKSSDRCLVTHIMKYFQIVLVLVMMALTTPLFYVQATKEITRSQNNKFIVEATTKSKTQSSLSSSEISISSVQLESSSVQSSSISSEIAISSSSSLVSNSSQIESSSSVSVTPIVKKDEKDDRKDELTAQILKSIEDKKIAEARKEELTKKILKQEEDRKAAEKKAAEEKRIAEEKAKEDERIKQEEKIAEEKRVEEEKKAVEARKIAEEKAKELAAKKALESPKVISSAAAGSFSEAIDIQCANYGCNPGQLKRIMMCESTGNANAQNGIYTGLFQFHPQTFAAYSARAGLGNANIYNGFDQIATAAYMFANGEARQWECK